MSADRNLLFGILAQDVERWLADEPVSAYRDPLLVRAGRWARKHRTLVSTAAAVGLLTLAALAVGLAVVGGLNQRLETANTALQKSNEQLEAARAEAERERGIAVAVNEFLQKDLLAQADVGRQRTDGAKAGRNPNITVAELLDRAARAVEGKFRDQPQTEAAIRQTIGDAYRALGKHELAQRHLERSLAMRAKWLGQHHPDTLISKNNLAVLYLDQGKHDKSEMLLLEVVRQCEKLLGPDHLKTLISKNNLATLYLTQRQYGKAEPLLLDVFRQLEQQLGQGHPETLTSKNNLALLYLDQGKHDKSEMLLLEVVRQCEMQLGPSHPETLASKISLAKLYWRKKKLDRSVGLFEEVVQQQRQKLGDGHLDTLVSLANLGLNYCDAAQLDKGIRCLEEALGGARTRPGGVPASLARVPVALARAYQQNKQLAKAEALYRVSVEEARQRFGADDPRTADSQAQLALYLLGQKKHAEVAKVLRDCLRIRQKVQPDVWTTDNTRSMLGEALLGQKQYAEAEPLLVQGYEGLQKQAARIPPRVRAVRLKEAVERLVRLYEATDNKDEAAKWRKKLAGGKK